MNKWTKEKILKQAEGVSTTLRVHFNEGENNENQKLKEELAKLKGENNED